MTTYKYFKDMPKTWSEAQAACTLLDGGRLAEPRSAMISNQLMELVGSATDVWLGAARIENGGPFYWQSDNSTFGYTSWAPHEPNNELGNENCL